MYAWVTTVVEEDHVDQALLLAGSLRRWSTAMKLVVVAASNISKSSRQRLSTLFDQVVRVPEDEELLGQPTSAILVASSLVLFKTCVYLSPSMLVLKNCDHLFDEYNKLVAGRRRNPAAVLSTLLDCFLFTPSLELQEGVQNKLFDLQAISPDISQAQIAEAAVANFLSGARVIRKLLDDDQYNVEIVLGENGTPTFLSGVRTASIVNFKGDHHPAQLWRSGAQSPNFENAKSSMMLQVEIARETTVALTDAWNILFETTAVGIARGPRNSSSSSSSRGIINEPVAIVGMSFRLPGGNTPDEFWATLLEGKDVVREIPPGRWTQDQVRMYWKDQQVQGGFLSVPIDQFDAKFFGISRKEATIMDPQQRLLLEVSWEALEEAGIEPLSLHGSQTGVFTGSWTANYRELASSAPDFDFFRSYMGNSIATGAARLSHFFGCTGPSIATESGCSSAIVAVDLAVKSLRARECSLALACGVNLLILPTNYHLMEGVLAPDYRCKTFDASANGFVRAEGVATLVMKRLSDARRDGDNIWGLVRGTGIAQEGVSKSLGTPTVQVESLAMKLALRDGGVEPGDVSYIEMHGTGTPVGDPMEVSAVAEAYRVEEQEGGGGGGRKEPLVIGSVKTNIGHTESVSGITGMIKVLLAMKHEKLPPHLNLENLNPEIDLEQIPAIIPKTVMEWRREPGRSRLAGVSSFGISGTDGHVIIEEPPCSVRVLPPARSFNNPERPLHLLKMSAKCSESLDLMAQKYAELLEGMAGSDDSDSDLFRDVCYSANTSRSTFSHRAVVIASGASEAARILREGSFKKEEILVGSTNPICFLFPGQGCQYPGMASSLYATSPTFRFHFDHAESLLRASYGISIKDIMWGGGSGDRGSPTEEEAQLISSRTLYSQTSIFVVEYCLLRLWESWGVKPDYVLGHSLGEFTAAVAAGALDFPDALLLVAQRARLIDNLPAGKMLVVRASKAEVDATILKYKATVSDDFWADTAALNSNDQTVLAGDSELIDSFAKFCTQSAGLKNILLASTHAFHSRHMDPMLAEYGRIANSIKLGGHHHRHGERAAEEERRRRHRPRYISGMEGRLIPTEEISADYWIRHTREPVRFLDATKEAAAAAAAKGVSLLFLEVGPHPILSPLTAANLEGLLSSSSSPVAVRCLPSLRRGKNEWSVLLESLAQLYLSGWAGTINWQGFDRDYPRRRVPLPFYPFNRKRIWVEVRPEPGLLHPLVGRSIPSSTAHFLYENELLLKHVAYVGDHVIGNTIVFPGAGFLEMCLAAGYAAVQRFRNEFTLPRRSIRLSGVTIATPLAVHESRATHLQTAVLMEGEELEEEQQGYTVKVSRRNFEQSGEAEWVTHVTAQFHPTAESHPDRKIDIESKKKSGGDGGNNSWTPFSLTDFYNGLPQVGLRFGPSFQSLIGGGWKRSSGEGGGGEGGMLFKVKIPADHQLYLIHPILADAMMQAMRLWKLESEQQDSAAAVVRKRLQVPVVIGDFVWVQQASHSLDDDDDDDEEERYIFCQSDPEGRTECTLVDGEGRPLAIMKAVEFLETNVKLVEGMIQQQSAAMPKMWEEIYKGGGPPNPLANSLQMEVTNWEPSEAFLSRKATCAVVDWAEADFYRRLCTMSRNVILETLYSCGWAPLQHQPFSVEELLESLRIVQPRYFNYINFFLRCLEGAGLLQKCEEEASSSSTTGRRFRFLSPPPSPHQLSEEQELLTKQEDLSRPEYKIMAEVGKNLKGILRGEVSPLEILFPADPTRISAPQAYAHFMRFVDGAIQLANEEVLTPLLQQAAAAAVATAAGHHQGGGGDSKGVVRILEVGAGTGAFSKKMLTFLTSRRLSLPFEYYYTDVSPSFFGKAKEELAEVVSDSSSSLIFKKFDMEVDPLEQGFRPGYFDLLLACEALHVASDIKATLARLRPLLKPGGVAQIMETIVHDPRITFAFGLLDGYWAFQDRDFRRDHITLSPAMWEEALLSANFDKVELIPAYQGVHGVILAVASKKEDERMSGRGVAVETTKKLGLPPPPPPRHAWLLLCDDIGSSPLSELLAERLARLNRKVILLPRRRTAQQPLPLKEEELKETLRSLISPFLATTENEVVATKLEGVLYLWGIMSDSGDSESEVVVDQSQISLPLLSLCQVLSEAEMIRTKVVVVTKGIRRGVVDDERSPMESPFAGSLIGLTRTISIEPGNNIGIKHLDLSPAAAAEESTRLQQVDQILANLWDDSSRNNPELAFTEGLQQLVPKLVSCKLSGGGGINEHARLPHGVKRFQLVLPAATRQFSDLEFAFLPHYAELEEDQVELEVKATALNFRDVFAVLKPSPEFDKINAVGLDVAGVVVKVGSGVRNLNIGDRVMGMQSDANLALPSHVKLPEKLAIPLPHQLTFAEGATLPAVLATAHHCLVTVARMKAGERLLVHSASGGVGLAAIQLAKRVGLEVVATAGSPRKRRFLRALMGIQHVFNSRATDFGAEILKVSQGAGVDIVLNSLTGPGFKEESLRVLKEGGRFVEMSKLNVWSVEEVALLRPDVSYSIADVGSLDAETFTELVSSLKGYLQEDLIQPIPYERFDALDIRRALAHLQQAKHIGKIVCVMPELGRRLEGKSCYHATRTPLFNSNSTYLVTGGLGGIGFEVVKWILRSGGKHVVIASRSSPRPAIASQIQVWNSKEGGKHVEALAVDVGNPEACRQLFRAIQENPTFPPLRGVMHAAGVLADAALRNQCWEKFRTTFNSKIDGSWNLHLLTKGMLLEHFVLFSSITATFGSPGQANHSAANSFQDTLARYRHSFGLPATSINWGNWGEVGVATDVDLPGVTPLSTAQGILSLETLLRSPGKTNVVVANIDSFALLSKLFTNVKEFVDDRALLGDSSAAGMTMTTLINANEFWTRMDSMTEKEGRVNLLLDVIKTVLKSVLRSEPDEVIDAEADFSSLGIDSLMMLEFKNGLGNILGERLALSVAQLQDCNTSGLLAEHLHSLLGKNVGGKAPPAPNPETMPTVDELKLLVREDSELPAHIRVDAHSAAAPCPPPRPPQACSAVLLTGVTGTLGPFLLAELTRRPHISAVYCLIRKAGRLSPAERLGAALSKAGLSGLVDLSKVSCIQGEIAEPRFGLSQADYDSLATEVEAVVHSAVKVDYNGTYWRAPESNKSTMRSTNVFGTRRVLEFCTSQRPKSLCHMSTILVYAKLGESGCLSEGWQDVDAFDAIHLNAGYPISKHVCEQLIRQAVEERGVPCTVIRLPLVSGHSQTGRCEPNHFTLRFLAEMKLGVMPENPFPLPCIPVDRAARQALSIFFHEQRANQQQPVYNLFPKHPDLEQKLVAVAKEEFGVEIVLVSYQEFIKRILEQEDDDQTSPLAPFKGLYTQDFMTNPDSPFFKTIHASYVVNSRHFFANDATVEILPNFEAELEPSSVCWRRDLRYLREAGLFEKFGISCKSP